VERDRGHPTGNVRNPNAHVGCVRAHRWRGKAGASGRVVAFIIILLALLGAVLLWAGLSGATPADVIRLWTGANVGGSGGGGGDAG